MNALAQNPWQNGLLVAIGSAGPGPDAAPVTLGGQAYDASPYLRAFTEIGAQLTSFAQSPYNIKPLTSLISLNRQIAPGIANMSRLPPSAREVVRPMASALSHFAVQASKLVQARMRTQIHIARAPKILIPVGLSIAAGGTTNGIQIRNPYLGATGGGTDGGYQYPWAITSFRTSNNENGQLQDKRLTQFILGGHDYVAASLTGLTYTLGGAPATQGWPCAAFTETKRGNWKTEVQPWTTVANHGAGIGWGSVMTETGFLQIGVFNGSAGTYNDTYSVYANATLCGNPFQDQRWSQSNLFRKSFVPLALQAPMAMRLAMEGAQHVGDAVDANDDHVRLGPLAWMTQTDKAARLIEGLLHNEVNVDVGDPIDPGTFSLADGARYVD